MPSKKELFDVLVVSRNENLIDLLEEILPPTQFASIIPVYSAGEAKRKLIETPFNIVIIDTPLSDDFGTQLALDISESNSCGVILLVKSELFEQVSFKVEDFGIATIAKPTSRQAIYSSIKILCATQNRLKSLDNKYSDLQEKMKEIRIVNRAKCLLIQHLKMTEPESHKYIEKQAMDRCVKKTVIAENIIKTYEQ